jgi:hypothetical protein
MIALSEIWISMSTFRLALPVDLNEGGDLVSLLQFGTGVFALMLSALSLYAWKRRKLSTLELA